VHILTTGDELIEPGQAMAPGGVRDANRYSISALVRLAGAELAGLASVRDDARATTRAVAATLGADVAVICGGVSVGAHDHVKRSLAELGVEERFWGVALKPGKPTWFGTHERTLVFGLPGNPVSAMVTFILFVRPALHALSGAVSEHPKSTAKLACDYHKSTGRAHVLRCRLELSPGGWIAHPTGNQGSHVLSSMLGAQALALIPTASSSIRAGEQVQIEMLEHG
jgi:molybdopterin molybdotransferase